MKVKEESEKVGLKLNIQKTKIRASGPITSWQIDEETVETVTTLYSWASQVAQLIKNSPSMQETWVQSVGWENPLEKGMAAQNILSRKK